MHDYSGLQLLPLFNAGYNFTRWCVTLRRWVGCNQKQATHKLRCTRWNSRLNYAVLHGYRLSERRRPSGWALSVCAVPLRRSKRVPFHRLRKPIVIRSYYRTSASLLGKRAILLEMIQTHPNPGSLREKIRKLPHLKCDALYRDLLRASKVARRKWARALRRQQRKLSSEQK